MKCLLSLFVLGHILWPQVGLAQMHPLNSEVQFLWKTLNGTNLNPQSPTFQQMEEKLKQGDQKGAAALAARAPESSVAIHVVKQIFTPLAGREINYTEPLGDFTLAWMTGVLLDQKVTELFFSEKLHVLTTSISYQAHLDMARRFTTTYFSDQEILSQLPRSNDIVPQYRAFKQDNLLSEANLGVITTTQYARSLFEGGTNRRPVKKIIEDFLCVDNIEQIMSFSINDNWVGRDIPRTPGKNPKDYLTRCVGCHAGMDAARGAFAKYDFVDDRISYNYAPQEKMNINAEIFPPGRKTVDDEWQHTGWIPTEPDKIGQKFHGPKDFMHLIVDSLDFYQCMVTRSQKVLCPTSEPKEETLAQIAYQLKKKQNFMDMLINVTTDICAQGDEQ